MDCISSDANQDNDASKSVGCKDDPTKDEDLLNEAIPQDNATSDGGDTSRVVDSATTYARDCLRTEKYKEATVALRSVLEISNPSTATYKIVMLHIAQLLQAANQLKASIDCMLSIYCSMPPPLSTIDAICIIARSYEQLKSSTMSRLWWKKLSLSSSSSGLGVHPRPGVRLWEAMADRLFDKDLYVFAADFYAQAMTADIEKQFVPSNRFRYRYLATLLAFIGPLGPTAHMDLCRSVAWSLVQWFHRQNGSAAHILACYRDPHFYLMCGVYFTSFPAMYRVVFAWINDPAGRIARCWKRHWAKLHPRPSSLPSGPSCSSREQRKGIKKSAHHSTSSCRELHSQNRSRLRGKVSATPSTSSSPTRKPRLTSTEPIPLKKCGIPLPKTSTEPGRKKERNVKQQHEVRTITGSNNNALSTEEARQFQDGSIIENPCGNAKLNAAVKKSSEFYDNSPTKRKLSVVKRMRTKRPNVDPTAERPSSANKISNDEHSATLLDVYPLQLPRTDDFVAICGREPGFADLDLNEVGEFARLAHYRARVLAGKHAPVSNLDTAKVKPQWLQDVERAVTLIETHQQRNLTSGKVVVESDSVAHLSEIHTRLVLFLTSIYRQYTRDFGDTSFTRRFRGITRKLVEWKFTRISEVVAALNDAKYIAMQEEKQRNLEFYHVHRAANK